MMSGGRQQLRYYPSEMTVGSETGTGELRYDRDAAQTNYHCTEYK